MFANKPDVHKYLDVSWERYEIYFQILLEMPLTVDTLHEWMLGWSWVLDLLLDIYSRLSVAYSKNTANEIAEKRYHAFLEGIYPSWLEADQQLKTKLLESGLEPENFAVQLQGIQAEAALFREKNLPLLSKEQTMNSEYEKILGAQTIVWNGEEYTITQMTGVYQRANRKDRERIWRLADNRRLADRQKINHLWVKFVELRNTIAENAGFHDYRAYQWQVLKRFDYSPEDCETFHAAIEKVGVPAASRVYERRRQRLNVKALRPWDLDLDLGVYPFSDPPLNPFDEISELESRCSRIFHQVDPVLGEYFEIMRREDLLDLSNRKGKAPGAFCTNYNVSGQPFIFANAVGTHEDVQTLLHEAGHAFHVFESDHLPYNQQKDVGSEFSEVASMGMELLAAPFLPASRGGFYSEVDAARARIEHLEQILLLWPYMAVVDAFQHWVYTHPGHAADPDKCDARWIELWERYIPGVDWSGLEDSRASSWHRKIHIHTVPFYYVEYGLAQLGAVEIWRNSIRDHAGSVSAYRRALAQGGTLPLPGLFKMAGAKFAFDTQTLQKVVALIEDTVDQLSNI